MPRFHVQQKSINFSVFGGVPARNVWTGFCNSGNLVRGMGLASFVGGSEAQFFKMPITIVAIFERGYRRAHFLDIPKDATMDNLLLQGLVEPFGHTVGVWIGDDGKARSNAPEPDLIEEVVGGVLLAVIHAQRQAATRIGSGCTELGLQPLSNGLQCSKPDCRS